ncbi:hypothetical protein FW756_02250 [Leucobacter sp. 1207-22]
MSRYCCGGCGCGCGCGGCGCSRGCGCGCGCGCEKDFHRPIPRRSQRSPATSFTIRIPLTYTPRQCNLRAETRQFQSSLGSYVTNLLTKSHK